MGRKDYRSKSLLITLVMIKGFTTRRDALQALTGLVSSLIIFSEQGSLIYPS